MATFSAVVSTEYAVGAPITSSWGSKVSNNVLAIIQGDATASSNRIQEAALASAVSAQLVTNGDSHNHSGGDGAAIPSGGLGIDAVTTAKIAALAVTEAKIAALAVTVGKIGAAAVSRSKLSTTTVSLAGTVASGTVVGINLTAYSFFPMIHMPSTVKINGISGNARAVSIIPNLTDGANPDAPSFAIYNGEDKTVGNYDVDYRYIQA